MGGKIRFAVPLVAVVMLSTPFAASAAKIHPRAQPRMVPLGAELYAQAHQRGIDQADNPAYQRAARPYVVAYERNQNDPVAYDNVVTDPFRLHWNRGDSLKVTFRNRYNARLVGHLWSPAHPRAPLPAIVFVPGLGGPEQSYWGLAQTFAENGYVVLTFDPQGDTDSDVDGTPKSTWCDPHGSWKQPQEGGITEQGKCAGEPGPTPKFDTVLPDVGPVPLGTLTAAHDGEFQPSMVASLYPPNRAPYVFGALDAVRWLLSDQDPWRSRVDAGRVGVTGHSMGADAAVVAAGVDPLHRFKAAVALDTYGVPPAGWKPSVPTMLQQSEQQPLLGPYLAAPPPRWWSSDAIASRLSAAHVPEALIALRASTHQEWDYVPEQDVNPDNSGLASASRWGERVGAYFALAWFDRYLKGDLNADRRILAARFDDSVDASSIGAGTYDVVRHRNQPVLIAGERVADHLSPLYATMWNFDGHIR